MLGIGTAPSPYSHLNLSCQPTAPLELCAKKEDSREFYPEITNQTRAEQCEKSAALTCVRACGLLQLEHKGCVGGDEGR